MKPKLDVVGGQAVIEGVLMKTKNKVAVAVRLPNKKIRVKKEKIKKLPKILTLPFIRGITTLIQILIIGIKALTWSANQQTEKEEEKISGLAIAGTLLLSFLFVLIFFIGIPFFLTKLFPIKNIFFTTIEGNTKPAGQREGGGVYARNRHLSDCIVGFVRPRLTL